MQPLTKINIPGRRKRQLAGRLREFHVTNHKLQSPSPPNPIRVVCISDTHNKRPDLPPGDILIHAGDLTENGSFDEVQAELNWLSDLPYIYKILVAGNHDVLLDESFLEKHPERRYGQTKTRTDLNWGDVTYLEDALVTLAFPDPDPDPAATGTVSKARTITIFGSPWTPRYGVSAFQYRADDVDHWESRLAALDPKPDILVTHGPPKHHLDARDFYRAGCPYLADEIFRLKPRLVVFGHIHASYGREDVVLDAVQKGYEHVMTGWEGWPTVVWMAVMVCWTWMFRKMGLANKAMTTFVNASVVRGRSNELVNEPIVMEL